MSYLLRSSVLTLATLSLVACTSLPFGLGNRTTPAPTVPLPNATPIVVTPQPGVLVTFAVRLPANTPANSAPAVHVLDSLGTTHTMVTLIPQTDGSWQGSAALLAGSVVRYRYVRPSADSLIPETSATNQPINDRWLMVPATNTTVNESVVAWPDAPFAGVTGQVIGVVRNTNTGRGVVGVRVNVAGQTALTASDGVFILTDVPVGAQRVTAQADEASLAPVQTAVDVQPGQWAQTVLDTTDPNQVHVVFVVRLPAEVDPNAQVRLVGNIASLGNSFIYDPQGNPTRASHTWPLTRLPDGRWAAQVPLYQGHLLEYAYTLSDGVWNRELGADGLPRTRRFVVPWFNATIEDTVLKLHTGTVAPITFEARAPANTPPTDDVSLQLQVNGQWHNPLPMNRLDASTWRLTVHGPFNPQARLSYRYCRNLACNRADDAQTTGPAALGRFLTPAVLPQTLRDTIGTWRWLETTPPNFAAPPALPPRPSFRTGMVLREAWQPNALPFYATLAREIQALGGNQLTVIRRADYAFAANAPLITDSPVRTLPAAEVRALAEAARAANVRLAVHPVTCPYNPYGPCDYFASAPLGPAYWNAWFAAYERHLLTQAEVAQAAGAEMLVIGDYKLQPALPGQPTAPPEADARWRQIIGNVRARFTGALAFELLMGQNLWPTPPDFFDDIDVIRIAWWSTLTDQENTDTPTLTQQAGALMDTYLRPLHDRFPTKPLVLTLYYGAFNRTATQCAPRPDGQCHAFTDFDADTATPANVPLDLAEQMQAYDAVFNAVGERGWIDGVLGGGYDPQVMLRDAAISPRGKPAEAVLSVWYARLQGR